MTTAELIAAGLTYYVNQGSSSVLQDPRQRRRAWFFLTKAAKRLWDSAPYWFRKANGTVPLTSGVGTMPADFSRIGTQGQVYIQGQLYRPLEYKSPDYVQFQIVNSPQTGTPWAYTLFTSTPSVRAQGLQEILCWPMDNSVLDVRAYDRKLVEMIDAPLACNATPTVAAGALTGTFKYKTTFVTARGETEGGFTSPTVSPSAQDVDLSAIPVWWGRTVTARNLYRTMNGGNDYFFLDTLADNVTTTYTDSTLDVALGAAMPLEADSVSGAEEFPEQFHESSLYDGLEFFLAKSQGDGRDRQFQNDWDRAVQRMWEEIQQGQNKINAFPPFPGFVGGNSVWSHWSPPS